MRLLIQILVSASISLDMLIQGVESGCLEFLGIGKQEDLGEISFAAVTSSDVENVYNEVRKDDKHLHADKTIIDKNIKHRICQSIASSGYMEMKNRDPSDMRTNYSDVFSTEGELMKSLSESWIDKLRLDYDSKMILNSGYNYRTRFVEFSGMQDFGFACMTKDRRRNELTLYFISDPYTLDLNPQEQVSIRFICRVGHTLCRLEAMAEMPAITFASPEYSVEDIYLQMRKYYNREQNGDTDPICRLDDPQKVRICASVMSTSRFVGKIKYFPDVNRLQTCKLQSISFQTDAANAVAGDELFDEWMLPCEVKPTENNVPNLYYVFRAYGAYHAFVYSYHPPRGGWYIENISGRISVVQENENIASVREEGKESVAPVLSVILRNPQKAINEFTK